MKYEIKSLNRIVDLDDKLVEFYRKHDDITESMFFVYIVSNFGDIPSKYDVSDDKISEMCNDLLLSNLEVMTLLPKAIDVVTTNKDIIEQAAKLRRKMEFEL